MTESILDAALRYHAEGLVVIPLIRDQKGPTIKRWQSEGAQTEARVRELFAKHAGNIGIVCGSASRLITLDIDTKPGKQGAASIASWEARYGTLPKTRKHKSASGGYHLLYRTDGRKLKTSHIAMGLHIDVQAEYAQVVAPPSVLVGEIGTKGRPQIPGPYVLVDNSPIADCPQALYDQLEEAAANALGTMHIDWAPVKSDDPTFAERVATQRDEFAKESVYLEGEGQGNIRYVMMIQRLGPGLLLDPKTTWANYREVYEPRLPDGHKWFPECEHELFRIFERAYGLQMKEGSRPDETWTWYTLNRDVKEREEAKQAPPAVESVKKETANNPAWGAFDWSAEDAPVEWLIADIIQAGTVNIAFGLPNSLKTWTMYLGAACVGSGKQWLGRKTKQGLVLILDYESSPRQARRRMRLLKQFGLTNVRYVNPTELLTDPKLWERIEALQPALLVVDSLSRGMLGQNENDPIMAVPLDRAKRLARSFDVAAVFIHHKNKSGQEGQGSSRGSNAIMAAAEGWLEFLDFERLAGGVQHARLHCGRLKEAVGFEDIKLELSDEKGLIEITEPAVSVKTSGRDDLTVEAVKAKLLLHIANVGPEGIGEKELLRKCGLSRGEGLRAGKLALSELVDSGQIDRQQSGRGRIYRPRLSPEQQKTAILQVIDSGITGEGEILTKAGADERHLAELAQEGVLYRSGRIWIRTAKAQIYLNR